MEDWALRGLGGMQAVPTEKMVGTPTLQQRLTYAVQEAEDRLAEAKRAKEIFEKHPELEELINIMQKGRF